METSSAKLKYLQSLLTFDFDDWREQSEDFLELVDVSRLKDDTRRVESSDLVGRPLFLALFQHACSQDRFAYLNFTRYGH